MKIRYGLVVFLALLIFATPLMSFYLLDKLAITPKTQGEGDTKDAAATDTISTGEMKLLDIYTGKVITVTDLDYLYGALASETEPGFHPEALKAQAVASYTYAYKLRAAQEQNKDSDLKGAHLKIDSSNSIGYISKVQAQEKFKDQFSSHWQAIETAAQSVYGEKILYKGEPIVASYHPMSSGKTETAETVWGAPVPYLITVDSSFDKKAKDYKQETSFDAQTLKDTFVKIYPDISLEGEEKNWIKDSKKSKAGTVTSITIGDKTLTGKDVRATLDLKSGAFDVKFTDGKFLFTTYGEGHGVGMSQNGANELAKNKKNYKDILLYYFPGTTVEK